MVINFQIFTSFFVYTQLNIKHQLTLPDTVQIIVYDYQNHKCLSPNI